ncbi:Uncharacterized protein dnm_006580 [Desulfonema magnum]|uniref:Uncharacterized protein n=1 Tax=Desulfonema magnum TaxID=45655 RepID=A0A975GKE4_9BACT|nr:Uncharacterized protein dnm_006580 [Desulfonema magnum]
MRILPCCAESGRSGFFNGGQVSDYRKGRAVYLDVEKAVTIGLFPEIDRDKFR